MIDRPPDTPPPWSTLAAPSVKPGPIVRPLSPLDRYILRQHLAPLGVALGVLTSLMLLNQLAKQLPDLTGKGLPSSVIVDVLVLSVPFIVAVTLPMAVLVAVLRAFTRLGAENEITELLPSGLSVVRLVSPVLWAAACVAALSFLWNDQLLPRSNHHLRTLLAESQRQKPSLAADHVYKSDREMTIHELRRAAKSAQEDAGRAAVEGRRAMEHAARQRAAMYEVEIQKKYAIAAACAVFALVGAPIGLRFRRGGLGLVIGVSSAVFVMYYVWLIGGEELADRLIVSPLAAMWTLNLVLGAVGLVALWRIRGPASRYLTGTSGTQGSLHAPHAHTVPRAVKIAAWILAGHGAAILLYAVLLQRLPNSQPDLSGAISRVLSMALVAWALLHRAQWAWWVSVVVAGLFLILCLFALVAVAALAEGEREMLPPAYALFLLLSALAFAAVVALLLVPSSRAAFRRPAV